MKDMSIKEVIDMVMKDVGDYVDTVHFHLELQPGSYVTFDIKKKDEC